MKRVFLSFLLILLSIAIAIGLSSCGGEEYNVSFFVDGDIFATIQVGEGEPIKAPVDPERDGYTFDGWYLDNGTWQIPFTEGSLLDIASADGLRVYAKWLCSHSLTEWITDIAPTCSYEGKRHKECSRCEEILEVAPIDKLTSHSPGEAVVESFLDSTCSAKGSYKSVVYCSACDCLISTEEVTVEKKPHTSVTDPAVAPTCSKAGLTAGAHCSVCSEIITAQAPIPPSAHTAKDSEYKAPTCTESGWSVGTTCEVCGEVIEAKENIPATGHTYSSVLTLPSCTEDGYTTHICHCGDTYVDAYVDALGHTSVTDLAVAPTCTATGLTAGAHCSVCSAVLTPQSTVAALGHTSVTDHAVVPTCTATGLTAGAHCSACSAVITPQAIVAALGHTSVTDPAVAPTCTATGLTAGAHCSVCSAVITAQATVAALGHTSVTDPAVAPTCTATGLTAGAHCSVCSAVLTPQSTVAALGHTSVTDPAVAPTCTATGLTAGAHCSVCSAVITAQATVAALGHTSVTDPAVAPTCTATGLTAGAHCSVCSAVITPQSTVAALGHTSVTDPAVAPTCTAAGLTAGAHCSVCNEILVAQTSVAPIPHTYDSEVVSEIYKVSAATTTFPAIYRKSCACGAAGTEVFTYGDVLTIPVASILLDKTDVEIVLGCTSSVTATVSPSDATNKLLSFTSSNESVVTVDENGTLVSLSAGTAVITVTADSGVLATCSVTVRVGGIRYSLGADSTFYYVSGYDGIDADVVIPSIYNGLRVKGIARNAFLGNTLIKSISIPSTVDEIEAHAFEGCASLESVALPAGVAEIKPYTFAGCTSLSTVTLSGATRIIGNSAFAGCTALTDIALGNALVTIEALAFDSCTSLSAIALPNTVITIGDMAFRSCTSLVEVALSNDLTKIGNAAFQYCTSLESITLHKNVKVIGSSAFSGCIGLKSLTVLGDITSWGDSAFYECREIEQIYIASRTRIEVSENNYVFFNVGQSTSSGLALTLGKDAVIPDNLFVPSVDESCYPKIASITVESGMTAFGAFSIGIKFPYLTAIYLSDSIEDIPFGIFHNSPWWEAQEIGEVYIGNVFYGYKCECDTASPSDMIVESRIDSDCINDGSYVAVISCTVCSSELSRATVTIPKVGHAYVENEARAADCLHIGWDAYLSCERCDYTTYTELEPLGHASVSHEARAAGCLSIGWDAYESCERCDHTTYVEIPATGHSYVNHEASAPDCEAVGWEAYTTCSGCEYTTYVEIPALGHKVLVTSREEVTVVNYTAQNDPTYPFSVFDGFITSTNKSNAANNKSATYTITAERDLTLSLEYKTSTEAGCDFLIIKHNGTEKVKASGNSEAYTAIAVDMSAGDTVTITYTKDEGDHAGSDCVFIRLKTSPTEVQETEETTTEPATEELISSLLATSDSIACATCGKTLAENPHEEGDT